MFQKFFSEKNIALFEILIIIGLACIPLFATFPYRVNIFLSWEGAYRISQGQLPFKDFGTPLGGMYWIVPGVFFKIFGAKMITLIKAQVFINIISGLAFRSILKSCKVQYDIRFVGIILYCLSFSFFNFWPWYNHTVIVYEFVGIAFLLKYITSDQRIKIIWLILAALFTCFSFLTKQDSGGMALFINLILLTYYSYTTKKWITPVLYIGIFSILFFLLISPFLPYSFGYWFNYGQSPHTARISIMEILEEFFSGSFWIKFYAFLIVFTLILRHKTWKEFLNDRQKVFFLLLTICILGEATVLQVTSYTPPDNNIFFHSFSIVFILSTLSADLIVEKMKYRTILIGTSGILLWWSSIYWNYIQRIIQSNAPNTQARLSPTGENLVNRNTYVINTNTKDIPMSQWKFSDLKSFDKIYMPQQTIDGINRLMKLDIIKTNKDLKVLNMTELTPLSVEIPYKLEKSENIPLWHHLGVGMFNKEATMYESKIGKIQYDLILFEYIPNLNNFFPFRIRDSIQTHYQKIDSFAAPRRGFPQGVIEVYVK